RPCSKSCRPLYTYSVNVAGIGRPRSRTRIAVSPRTAASCVLSARASRGTTMVAGSMLNEMTTRVAAQVAMTTSDRAAATPSHRWEMTFIRRGDFHTKLPKKGRHFPRTHFPRAECESYNYALSHVCAPSAGLVDVF